MDCQIRRAELVAELVLVGSLDSSWTPYLADQIDELVRAGAHEVWFDMSGVTYLSSHGIAIIVRYHRQLLKIGGRVRIVAGSELVTSVLKLSGVTQVLDVDGQSPAREAGSTAAHHLLERDGMTLQVFPVSAVVAPPTLSLLGDPARLPGRGYETADEQTWMAKPGTVAFGLGALGPNFEECRSRFGEFLAVAGVAAYRPSEGQGRPDFEHSAGAFVPMVRVLHGLAFPTALAAVIRFEATAGPDNRASVPLSRIALACLDRVGGGVVGVVIAGESDGLVGAAIRRSPVGLADDVDPFIHPDVRDWLSITPEPEHSRSMALAVGVATARARPGGRSLRPAARRGGIAGKW